MVVGRVLEENIILSLVRDFWAEETLLPWVKL